MASTNLLFLYWHGQESRIILLLIIFDDMAAAFATVAFVAAV